MLPPPHYYVPPPAMNVGLWSGGMDVLSRATGFSNLLHNLPQSFNGQIWTTARLLLVGSVIEAGRRLYAWLCRRFSLRYRIVGTFYESDISYEWLLLFLTQQKVLQRSFEFRVAAASSARRWGVQMTNLDLETGAGGGGDDKADWREANHADYIPMNDAPTLFRWNGYLMDVQHTKFDLHGAPGAANGQIFITIFTRDPTALSRLVEEARLRYIAVSQPHVTVYQATMGGPGMGYGGPSGFNNIWNAVKRKRRRPIDSVVLQEGVLGSLVKDIRAFLKTESWYAKAGIPHRRGYLLHGPPGTGKTSTIYAIAGELNVEIFSLSLASSFVDDSFLQRAVSCIPKRSIFLLEDIDCAFPPREGDDDSERPTPLANPYGGMQSWGMPIYSDDGQARRGRSQVTLSGLLNVLDGAGSEEGKIFFATTNFVDNLDEALIRPGRIDVKIKYHLANASQARALFIRFFPEEDLQDGPPIPLEQILAADDDTLYLEKKSDVPPLSITDVLALADKFASLFPDDEFSTAELQGYLLAWKKDPQGAFDHFQGWINDLRKERHAKEERERKRKEKIKRNRDYSEAMQLQGGLAKLGMLQERQGSMLAPVPGAVDTTVLPVVQPSTPPTNATPEVRLEPDVPAV